MVLSKIIFYLLQDGYTLRLVDVGSQVGPALRCWFSVPGAHATGPLGSQADGVKRSNPSWTLPKAPWQARSPPRGMKRLRSVCRIFLAI